MPLTNAELVVWIDDALVSRCSMPIPSPCFQGLDGRLLKPSVQMNWEVLSAASSIISTLVIAASAVAAIIQLGHVRAGNAISGFIGFMDKWSTPVVDRLAHPEVGRTVRRG